MLEDRILYSASPISIDLLEYSGDGSHFDSVPDHSIDSANWFDVPIDSGSILDLPFLYAPITPVNTWAATQGIESLSDSPTQLVIVDGSVINGDALVADILGNGAAGQDIHVIVLDSTRDGIQQISEVLSQYRNVDAVHFVTHAEGSSIQLGSTWLSNGNLADFAGAIGGWGQSLSLNADLLFYGCNLAGSADGQLFLESIGNLTHADIAASVNDTGHAIFGGDWDLEYTIGAIDSHVVFSSSVQNDWLGKLAIISVTTFDDVVDGNVTSVANLLANRGDDGFISLREAILAINAGAGGDTINLAAGTYTLSIAGTGENAAASGDLDILKSMSILGTGSDNTIINANGIDRVFHVLGANGQLTLSNLAVQGGNAGSSAGGGLLVATSTNQLTLNSVTVSGNSATSGAGIDNAGTLSLTDVTINNNGNQVSTTQGGGLRNTANATLNRVTLFDNRADSGGGIYNDFGSGNSLTLTNVTVSGNTAASSGGGLYTRDPVTITNSTFTLNTSDTGGGIRTQSGGATVSLQNTIVAGNIGTSTAPDMSGSFFSGGNNLIGNGTGQSSLVHGVNGDQVGTSGSPVNALLGALAFNGGHTKTHALLTGSTAINAGNSLGAPAYDQRGISRSGAVDIGAYELNSSVRTTAEFLVNDTILDQQITSAEDRGSQQAVSFAADGSYVVTWTSLNQDGSGQGVYAQRFDSTGAALTAELPINFATTNDQQWARVASASNGSFVVTWTSNHGTTEDVYFRRFAADGTPLSGDILVNTTTAGVQKNSSIGMDATGAFVIAWQGNGTQTGQVDSAGIFAQRFNSVGVAIGGEFRINSATANTQYDASISVNDSGAFVVVWDDSAGIHFQRFDNSGASVGSQTTFDGSVFAGNGAVALHNSGSFVVTWREGGGTVNDIYARRYDSAGIALTSRITVNSTTANNQANPSISIDASGNFIIVWEGEGVGDASGVFGQKYTSSGTAIGGNFLVNQTVAGTQSMASIDMVDSSNFVVVWSGNGNQTGQVDASGVFARQFGTTLANSPPTDIAPNAFAINENTNTTSGVSVGTLLAIDPDTGETFIWSIRPGGDGTKFSIGGTGMDQLILTDGVLDFESKPSYSVTVRVTDSFGNTYDETLTINVNDINETPVIANQSFNVNEISSNGTVVGTVAASDVDTGANGTLNYAITGGTGVGIFAVNATTGQITVTNSSLLNFETIPSFTLTVRASDGGTPSLNSSATITINLNDVNETPAIANQSFNVNENSSNGTVVGTASASDGDAGANGTLSYAITGGTGVSVFAVNATTGQITVMNSSLLNFETTPSLTLTVRASDGGTPSLNSSATITINLNDVNETPVIANQSFNVNENSSNGTAVGTVASSDVDSGANGTLSYSITGGTGVGVFAINATTGQITVTNSSLLNFETTPSFTLTVRTSDGGTPSLNSSATITINLNDINETPTDISPNSLDVPDATNTSGGFLLVSLLTSDPDGGDSFTYTILSGGDGPNFSIGGAGNDQLFLDDGVLNGTFKSVYTVNIRTTDSGGLTRDETLIVNVTSVNQPPTDILPGLFAVNENVDTSSGYSVGTMTATDIDGGETFTWSIQPGLDGGLFSIGGTNSDELILSNGVLSFESTSGYSVNVRVTDSAGNIFDKVILVSVNDLNEAPTTITPVSFNINENTVTSGGFSLGLLNATDPDSGDSFTWSILPGLDSGSFNMGGPGNNELILSDGVLDFETKSSYSVTVRVTDSGGNSIDQLIVVSVDDLNEAATVSLVNIVPSLPEDTNTTSSIRVADIVVADDVLGTNTLSLGGSDAAKFEIVGGNQLHLRAGVSLDYETQSLLNVTVMVDDPGVSGTPDNIVSFALAVLDFDEAPVPTEVLLVGPAPSVIPVDPGTSDKDGDAPFQEATEPVDDRDGPAVLKPATLPVSTTPLVDAPHSENQNAFSATELNLNLLTAKTEFRFSVEPDSFASYIYGNRSASTSTNVVAEGTQNWFISENFLGVLNEMRDEASQGFLFNSAVLGSTIILSSSLSVGYVLWLIRGGVLLSSVLTSLPAWRMVDPLPVLGYFDDDELDADDDSLESMVDKSNSAKLVTVQR